MGGNFGIANTSSLSPDGMSPGGKTDYTSTEFPVGIACEFSSRYRTGIRTDVGIGVYVYNIQDTVFYSNVNTSIITASRHQICSFTDLFDITEFIFAERCRQHRHNFLILFRLRNELGFIGADSVMLIFEERKFHLGWRPHIHLTLAP